MIFTSLMIPVNTEKAHQKSATRNPTKSRQRRFSTTHWRSDPFQKSHLLVSHGFGFCVSGSLLGWGCVCDGERRREERSWGEGLVCGREGEKEKNERGRRRERHRGRRERVLGREGEKERKRKKRDKVRDTWHKLSGWKEIMKSSTANQVMTHGKGRFLLFKTPTSINYSRNPKSINSII
jgi:hypothetical protein